MPALAESWNVVEPLTIRILTKLPEPLIEVLLSDRCAGIVSKAYHDQVGFETIW